MMSRRSWGGRWPLWGDGISALLIDGKLSDGRRTFPTVNQPGEVLRSPPTPMPRHGPPSRPRGVRLDRLVRNTELRVRCVRNCAMQCNSTSKNYAN